MGDNMSELDKLFLQLERQRDELKVKLHLAKADARAEWDKLEQKWGQLQARKSQVQRVLNESSDDVGAAARLMAEEIQKGYQRLRRLF